MLSMNHYENIIDSLNAKELVNAIADKFVKADKAKEILPLIKVIW